MSALACQFGAKGGHGEAARGTSKLRRPVSRKMLPSRGTIAILILYNVPFWNPRDSDLHRYVRARRTSAQPLPLLVLRDSARERERQVHGDDR